MDNFKDGRATVGEMLMAMEIADMGAEETTVVIEGADAHVEVDHAHVRDKLAQVLHRTDTVRLTPMRDD